MNIKLWNVLWCILDEVEVSILQVAAKAGSVVVCTNLLPADFFPIFSRMGRLVCDSGSSCITEKTLKCGVTMTGGFYVE